MTTVTTKSVEEWTEEIFAVAREGQEDGFEPFAAMCAIVREIKDGK